MTQTQIPVTSATSTTITLANATTRRRSTVAVWCLRILLALFFAGASALPKLLAMGPAVSSFDSIGIGHWFMYLVGSLELAGAVGLLLRPLARTAALCLIALLAGAFATQLVVFHGANAATPLILMVPLAVIARYHRR
ncbi:DoxX family protein [Streptacidiphilus sp. N1-12]|uniref:DoxX family protein n=2 Tax=Streptacidiphilus alkalitolerans TaxID=3342712 RepID=A0ABV6V5H1_9ACTN